LINIKALEDKKIRKEQKKTHSGEEVEKYPCN
jgi:hypothetical protein